MIRSLDYEKIRILMALYNKQFLPWLVLIKTDFNLVFDCLLEAIYFEINVDYEEFKYGLLIYWVKQSSSHLVKMVRDSESRLQNDNLVSSYLVIIVSIW